MALQTIEFGLAFCALGFKGCTQFRWQTGNDDVEIHYCIGASLMQ